MNALTGKSDGFSSCTPSTTTALSDVEDAVETQYIASLQIDAIDDTLNDHSIVRCRDAVETQYIASLQIDDTLNDHSIVRCRDAIYCVSLRLIASHCVSLRLIDDMLCPILPEFSNVQI